MIATNKIKLVVTADGIVFDNQHPKFDGFDVDAEGINIRWNDGATYYTWSELQIIIFKGKQ